MEPKAKKKKDSKEKTVNSQKYINTKPVLDEAVRDTVVVSWGRMNPVTSGHEKLAQKVASVAKERGATPMIFLSHSSDPKKNPLSYDDKVKFAQAAFGKIVMKSTAKTIIQVAAQLSKQFKNMVLVVGSDRVSEFNSLLNKYNGKDYKFNSIEVVSAGERDPDADDVSGMSASKMRALAADDDLNTFKKGLPKKLQAKAKQVFDAVRDGMGINEGKDGVDQHPEVKKRFSDMRKTKPDSYERRRAVRRLMNKKKEIRNEEAEQQTEGVKHDRYMRSHGKKASGSGGWFFTTKAMGEPSDDEVFSGNGRLSDVAKQAQKHFKTKDVYVMESLDSEEMTLDEVMDMAQRRKRAIVMKKHAKKIARARARSMKKKATKEKLQGRAEKQVKNALKDKFAKGKNYADLSISQKQAIEKKIKKISAAKIKNMVKKKLPDVKKAEKERMSKKIDVEESSKYYTGVAKNKKDDREAHFARKAKMDDDNPKAYTPAPGDKEAKTKPSKYTKRFKQMYGEAKTIKVGESSVGADATTYAHVVDRKIIALGEKDDMLSVAEQNGGRVWVVSAENNVGDLLEANRGDQRVKKRPHMLMASNGGVKFDNRFKVYKAWKEKWAKQAAEFGKVVNESEMDIMDEIMNLAEDVEFIFESNPEKSLKDKAAKTGIAYGILKKVFDRGVAAWRTGHRPGTTPVQWGLARVNSFATGGKTRTTADADLWADHSGK